jgi:hypothetical protein
MNRQRWIGCLVLVTLAAVTLGCGSSGPPRKQTFVVKGKLVVDGQAPGSPIQIVCHPTAGMDTNMPTFSQTESLPDGTFEISTYQAGDGVPVGDYVLTMSWQEMNLISRSYTGPDKLHKKYVDPAASEFKFTVKDKPVDLGELAITAKK